MPNYLFNQYNQNTQTDGILKQFNDFRNNFKGDAREQIQQMLNSGRITQEQYNQAVQKANAFARMLGMR